MRVSLVNGASNEVTGPMTQILRETENSDRLLAPSPGSTLEELEGGRGVPEEKRKGRREGRRAEAGPGDWEGEEGEAGGEGGSKT